MLAARSAGVRAQAGLGGVGGLGGCVICGRSPVLGLGGAGVCEWGPEG